MTQVTDDGMIKISAWYDNEWGYAQRLVEMARYMGQKINDTL
jgi:glyceraldehyde 3-phosphate dehydrogenase